MEKVGIGGIPLKATKYALDQNGVEHVFWDKELPPGWRRKYAPARSWREHHILPIGIGILLIGAAFLFHGEPVREAPVIYAGKQDTYSDTSSWIDISEIYPFTEQENSVSSTEEHNAAGHMDTPIPILPYVQPRPTLPPVPQPASLPSQEKISAKETIRNDSERSPIAFIGGDGVNLTEKGQVHGKEDADNGSK